MLLKNKRIYAQLTHLFERLHKFNTIFNPERCVLVASQVEFLGYMVNARDTSLVPKKVKSIVAFQEPSYFGQLRLNFYRQFLPEIAEVLLPLAAIIVSKHKPRITCTPEVSQAFTENKRTLAILFNLHIYDPAHLPNSYMMGVAFHHSASRFLYYGVIPNSNSVQHIWSGTLESF